MIIKDHKGFTIHLHFQDTRFKCPHCKKKYNDKDDKYHNRINKNKTMVTKVKCTCGIVFYLAVDYTGKFQTFEKEIKR
jgi:transposase-like protein